MASERVGKRLVADLVRFASVTNVRWNKVRGFVR